MAALLDDESIIAADDVGWRHELLEVDGDLTGESTGVRQPERGLPRMGTVVLKDIIDHLGEFEPDDTVYVPEGSPVDAQTKVKVIRFDPDAPHAPPGYRYFLEVGVMREVVDGLEVLLLRRATSNERIQTVKYHAEHDSFMPQEEFAAILEAPVGYTIPEGVVTHEKPAWADLADTSIYWRIAGGESRRRWEEIRAHRIADDQFVICCIPFFAGALSLGDTVRTVVEEGRHVIADRVRSAGHNTWHVFFSSASEGAAQTVVAQLQKEQAPYESYSTHVLSMDQVDPLDYGKWASFFRRMKEEYFVIATQG
jgi:hypothetical protein